MIGALFYIILLFCTSAHASRLGPAEKAAAAAQSKALSSTALIDLIESPHVRLPIAEIWEAYIIPYLGNQDGGPLQELNGLGKKVKNLHIIRTTPLTPQSTHINRSVEFVTFSHDESKVLATTKAECVVWDIKTEKQISLKSFNTNESEPFFSADDQFVLKDSSANECDKWHCHSGKYLGTVPTPERNRSIKKDASFLTTQQNGSNEWIYTNAEQSLSDEKVQAPRNSPGRVVTTLFNRSKSLALTYNKKNQLLYDQLNQKNLLHLVNAQRGASIVFQPGFIKPTLNQWLVLMMLHDKKKSRKWWNGHKITLASLAHTYKVSHVILYKSFASFDEKDQSLACMNYTITDKTFNNAKDN